MSSKKNNKKKWILYILLIGFIIKLFSFLFKNKNLKNIGENLADFKEEEEEEIKDLVKGKQGFSKFCGHSCNIFKNYFIPSEENDHKPKILQPRSLVIIVILLAFIKISIGSYMFFIYPNKGKMITDISQQVLELTNQDRINNNLAVLNINPVLTQAAQKKAEDMIANNYFNHYGPDGKKPWDWIDEDSYPYILVGENLAMNFSSANSAHTALMASESHKRNILNQKYNDIGLAVVSGEINGEHTNLLVEFFASQYKASAAIAQEINSTIQEAEINQGAESKENEIAVLSTNDSDIIIENNTSIIEEEVIFEDMPQIEAEAENIGFNLEKANISPNLALENDPNPAITLVSAPEDRKIGLAMKLTNTAKYIYIISLALLVLALLANIVIRVSVQHKPVIAQTLLVIIFVIGLLTIKIHWLENVASQIAVL